MNIIKQGKGVLSNDRGNTLMEAICGFAILTLIVVGIYGGFLTAQKTLLRGDDQETDANAAYGSLERGEATTTKNDVIILPLGKEKVVFQGEYAEAGWADNGTLLYSFSQSGTFGPSGLANDIRGKYETLLDEMQAIEDKTKPKPADYPKYKSNDEMRKWMMKNYFDGAWPTMPQSFLKANGISTEETLYIQPHWSSATGEIIIFAKNTPNSGWFAGYVYDSEEGLWYYNERSGISVTQDWAKVKAEIHKKPWRPLDR